MKIRTYKSLRKINKKLNALASALATALEELETIMTDLTRLTEEVNQSKDVQQSAITLLGGLSDQIRALSTDPAALTALADQLDAQSADLAAAVTANTPADAPPTSKKN